MLENEVLSRYTTYRIGGPARYFLGPAEVDDVAKALQFAPDKGVPWVVLG
jgi:UDP-N-acetylmuramate dehydrogenase